MGGRISPPVIAGLIVGIGLIIILAVFVNLSTSSISPVTPKISSDDAIHIVGNDILKWNREHGINFTVTDIAIDVPRFSNYSPTYVSYQEFKKQDMKLPLVFVSPNDTIIQILENHTSKIVGQCHAGLRFLTYCGYLAPFELGYKGRLVYGVEMLGLSNDNQKEKRFYVVDAMNGQIVDSTYVRYVKEQQGVRLLP